MKIKAFLTLFGTEHTVTECVSQLHLLLATHFYQKYKASASLTWCFSSALAITELALVPSAQTDAAHCVLFEALTGEDVSA